MLLDQRSITVSSVVSGLATCHSQLGWKHDICWRIAVCVPRIREGFENKALTPRARFGKAGELMIYDALLSDPDASSTVPADEFMGQRLNRYQNPPQVADIFSAGLDIELIRGDEREIVAHVTHCEWARYYLEHHPSVGYLLACSTDDPMYRLQCDDVRFQRRCTLMEGGDYCEFCLYRL